MMTVEQRTAFRLKIGAAVLAAQDEARDNGIAEDVVIPEVIAALISLAAYVAKNNASMSSYKFSVACEVARSQEWADNPPRVSS